MPIISKPRLVTLLAILLIGSIILAAFVLAVGFSDPIANENQIWQTSLAPMKISSGTRDIQWLRENLPQPPFSVRITASHASGDLDSAYGILLDQENSKIAVMVSPLGYTSIWRESNSTNEISEVIYLPWQSWPHVRTGNEENEIYISLIGDSMSVRVNRELLWEGSGIDSIYRIGIMGESFGEDAAIRFQLAEISSIEPRS
jgi:hypothetical protein